MQSDGSAGLPGPLLGDVQHIILSESCAVPAFEERHPYSLDILLRRVASSAKFEMHPQTGVALESLHMPSPLLRGCNQPILCLSSVSPYCRS